MSQLQSIILISLGLIGLALQYAAANPSRPATNEELLGSLQSLVISYNELDNKLQRHEHRERALGELVKKALQSLQKGQKNLEPPKGIFTRLDDRVSQIETMLITQEEKYNVQSDKFSQAVEHMFKWMRENDECFKHPPGSVSAVAAPAAASLPNDFIAKQELMNKQLLEGIQSLSLNMATLMDSSQKAAKQTENSFEQLPKRANDLLSEIEKKLQQFTASIAASVATAATTDKSGLDADLLERLNSLSKDMALLTDMRYNAPAIGLSDEDRKYLAELNDKTANALNVVSVGVMTASEGVAKTTDRLQQVETHVDKNFSQLNGFVADSAGMLERFYEDFNSSQSKMNNGIEMMGNYNSIMMTNSEVLLDTQRKVEFGTLQIVQKVSNVIEQQLAELSKLLKSRFTDIDESIINSQVEANQNISSQLNTGLEQIWHHIEIMSGDITESSEMLRVMKATSDLSVNTTYDTVKSLSSKVEETKNRMIDMDSNLNFLLGKLSLMSTEFSNIKRGLAESLEDLRKSFQELEERRPSGQRSNIEKNQYQTDVNLLAKRHAEGQ